MTSEHPMARSRKALAMTAGRLAVALLAVAAGASSAADPGLSPQAPRDRPGSTSSRSRLDRAIAPYVAQARASYPEARQRFLNGLGRGESFFVVTHLSDAKGRREQVFIAVRSIEGSRISGAIWNQVHLVEGYRYRDPYSFDDSRLVDWMISKPDGSEEGNVVGRFLDTYEAK